MIILPKTKQSAPHGNLSKTPLTCWMVWLNICQLQKYSKTQNFYCHSSPLTLFQNINNYLCKKLTSELKPKKLKQIWTVFFNLCQQIKNERRHQIQHLIRTCHQYKVSLHHNSHHNNQKNGDKYPWNIYSLPENHT